MNEAGLYDPQYPTMGYNPGITLPDPNTGLYRVNLSVFGVKSDLGHQLDIDPEALTTLEGLVCKGCHPGPDVSPTDMQRHYEDLLEAGYQIVKSVITPLPESGCVVSADIRLFDTPVGQAMKEWLESEGPSYFGMAGLGIYTNQDGELKRYVHEIYSFDPTAIPRTGHENDMANKYFLNSQVAESASS